MCCYNVFLRKVTCTVHYYLFKNQLSSVEEELVGSEVEAFKQTIAESFQKS